MPKQVNDTTHLREDIAVINNKISNLTENFNDFRGEQKKFCENITTKVDVIENKEIATDQKVSGMAVFQSVFSVIIGAISAYLGTNK
jgi:hypothetical protein